MNKTKELLLRIADIGFLIRWEYPDMVILRDPCYNGFIFRNNNIAQNRQGLRHLSIVDVRYNGLQQKTLNHNDCLLVNIPDYWRLYSNSRGNVLEAFYPPTKECLSTSFISRDFKQVVYYPQVLDDSFRRGFKAKNKDFWAFVYLVYPLVFYLLANILAKNGGCFIHGAAVVQKKKGFAFVGKSGSGKTTLAGLFRKEPGVKVLTDENMIVVGRGRGFCLYGTPWPGGGRISCASSSLLKGICFISHGTQNRLYPISAKDATKRLISQVILNAGSKYLISSNLKFIPELVKEVSCYDFQFINDRSAVRFLRENLF